MESNFDEDDSSGASGDNEFYRLGDLNVKCEREIIADKESIKLESEVGKLVPGRIIKNNGGVLIVDLDGVGMVEIENRFAATRLSGTGGYLFDVGNLVVRIV